MELIGLSLGLVFVMLVICAAAVIILGILLSRETKRANTASREAQLWIKEREAAIRKDAVARSKRTMKGQVAEQFVPFIRGFEFNPKDCIFLGRPIDFVVFDGISDPESKIEGIYLLEVKTGKSRLSKRQREVRDALDRGDVFFEELRVEVDEETNEPSVTGK